MGSLISLSASSRARAVLQAGRVWREKLVSSNRCPHCSRAKELAELRSSCCELSDTLLNTSAVL